MLTLLLLLTLTTETITYVAEPVYFEAEVTAYSEIDSCHTGKSCLMANGEKARVGKIACPRNIALGTWVEIAGEVYECADRTAKWLDGRYDLFFGYGKEAHRKALEFGVKNYQVAIINN